MTYFIINTTTGDLANTIEDGKIVFIKHDDLTTAINDAEALSNTHAPTRFRHITMQEYVAWTVGQVAGFAMVNRKFAELRDAVTEHLDAVHGATDVDEFIAEHEELAEAIGYEFVTETTFEVTLEVVVKHRPGKTDLEDALDVQVSELYGYGDSGIIDIDVTDINFYER